MSNFWLVLSFIFFFAQAKAQDCLPSGIDFMSQNEIDSFSINYPGCQVIGGSVSIAPSITNLNGLSVITHINGDLIITPPVPFSGLDNLVYIEGSLEIQDQQHPNFNGLGSLDSIGGNLSVLSGSPASFQGLEQLVSIGGDLNLIGCSPASFLGLEQLVSIGGDFDLPNPTPSLQDFQGLESLTTIGGNLNNQTSDLNNFHGLESLTTIGGDFGLLPFAANSYQGLDNLTKIGGTFRVDITSESPNFEGLEKLTSIGQFTLMGVIDLQDFTGLTNLNTIVGLFSIEGCGSLISLIGLENLQHVGALFIKDNASLISLKGLQNLKGTNLSGVTILNNTSLEICNFNFLCDMLSSGNTGGITINGNGSTCNGLDFLICSKDGISGTVFYDFNQNQLLDSFEYGIANQAISFTPSNNNSLTDESGLFFQLCDSATTYDIAWVVDTNWVLTTDSSSYHVNFIPGQNNNLNKNFGLYRPNSKHEVLCNLTSNPPRCNSVVDFFLRYTNYGTYVEQGNVVLAYDPKCEFVSISPDLPVILDTVLHTITWPFDPLYPGERRDVRIAFQMPDQSQTGKPMSFNAEIWDLNPALLHGFGYRPTVLCAFDPNDKNVMPPGEREEHFTLHDKKLTYTIRFQNTGNAAAIDIKILDTISDLLDINTLRIVNSSFPVQTSINDHAVQFFFPNIWLQDSLHNEPQSHGFVTYEIVPKAGLSDYSVIENTAFIIFDLNPAIVTNTSFSTMVTTIPVSTTITQKIPIYLQPNPASDILRITTPDKFYNIQIINILGEIVYTHSGKDLSPNINISDFETGFYFVRVDFGGKLGIGKFVVE